MKYIAKSDGFVGGVRIRAGQTFKHEGKPGLWMEPVVESQSVQQAEAPAEEKPRGRRKQAEAPAVKPDWEA